MNLVEIRPAGVADSAEIARLFLISSDGLAEYIWSRMAEPGETAEQAGARPYARWASPSPTKTVCWPWPPMGVSSA